jgi:hypothetical protein
MDRPAVADYPAGAGLQPRVIEDFEFVWMLRGRATFVVSEETPLSPGELLLVPPVSAIASAGTGTRRAVMATSILDTRMCARPSLRRCA